MNRQRQIDVIGTYSDFYDLSDNPVVNLRQLIPEELQTPGERLVLELTVTVRKADRNDKADGIFIRADNPA